MFDYKEYMQKGSDHIKLLGYYWEKVGIRPETKKEAQIEIRKNIKRASELLALCDDDLNKAKEKINIIGDWASHRGLYWSLETVLKKYMEADIIKEKEQKRLNKLRNGKVEK